MEKVLFLLLLITISSGATASIVDVSPFCLPNDPARKLTNDADKVRCTQWVNGSETWEGAMTNANKALIEVAKSAKPAALDIINKQMVLFARSEWDIDPLVGNCSQAFDAYIDANEKCLEWASDPHRDTSMDLSTAFQVDHFHTCKQLIIKVGDPVAEIDLFNTNKSLYNIPLAIISAKSGGHGCCETAINDESHNSSRFCFRNDIDNENDRALCQKWVYGSRRWGEAVAKVMETVAGIANSTKPNALDAIRAKLVPLGVDPEPIVANCSQAFDAYVGYKIACIGFPSEYPLDGTDEYIRDIDYFSGCKQELLNKANLSFPEIDQFDLDKSINKIINGIIRTMFDLTEIYI